MMISPSRFKLILPSSWLFQEVGMIAGKAIIANEYRKNNKSLKNVEYHIEEFVRQWMLQEITTTYEFPEHWLRKMIVVEDIIYIGSGRCRADVAIKNRQGDSIILIETKSSSCRDNDFIHAEMQLKSYLSATHSAIFGIVTNGYQTRVIRKRYNPNTYEIIEGLPSLQDMIKQGIFGEEDVNHSLIDMPIPEDETELEEIYPTVQEYIDAFTAIEPYISNNQKTMLAYHYHAIEQTVTMTELSTSVGYANHRGGNLQYGKLGQLLCAELDWAYGIAINVLAWFTPPNQSHNGQWLLTLRPEVSEALERLEWF